MLPTESCTFQSRVSRNSSQVSLSDGFSQIVESVHEEGSDSDSADSRYGAAKRVSNDVGNLDDLEGFSSGNDSESDALEADTLETSDESWRGRSRRQTSTLAEVPESPLPITTEALDSAAAAAASLAAFGVAGQLGPGGGDGGTRERAADASEGAGSSPMDLCPKSGEILNQGGDQSCFRERGAGAVGRESRRSNPHREARDRVMDLNHTGKVLNSVHSTISQGSHTHNSDGPSCRSAPSVRKRRGWH